MNISELFLVAASALVNHGLVMDCNFLLDRRTREQVKTSFVSGCAHGVRSAFDTSKRILIVSTDILPPNETRRIMTGEAIWAPGLQNSFSAHVSQITVQANCPDWRAKAHDTKDYGNYPLRSSFCFDWRRNKYNSKSSRMPTHEISLAVNRIHFGNRTRFVLEKYHSQGVFATRLLISVTDIIHFTMYPDRVLPRDLFDKPFSPLIWFIITSYKCLVILVMWGGGVRDLENLVLKILCSSVTAIRVPRMERFLLSMIVGMIMFLSTIPTTAYRTALTSMINKPPLQVMIRSEEELKRSNEAIPLAGYNGRTVRHNTSLIAHSDQMESSFNDLNRVIKTLQKSQAVAIPDLTLRMLEATHLSHLKIYRLERSRVAPLVEYVAIRPNTIEDLKNLRPWALRIFESRLYRFLPLNATAVKGKKRLEFAVKFDSKSLKIGLLRPLFIAFGFMNSVSVFAFIATLIVNQRKFTSKKTKKRNFLKELDRKQGRYPVHGKDRYRLY